MRMHCWHAHVLCACTVCARDWCHSADIVRSWARAGRVLPAAGLRMNGRSEGGLRVHQRAPLLIPLLSEKQLGGVICSQVLEGCGVVEVHERV